MFNSICKPLYCIQTGVNCTLCALLQRTVLEHGCFHDILHMAILPSCSSTLAFRTPKQRWSVKSDCNCSLTRKDDPVHPGVSLQEGCYGEGILEVLPHPQVESLKASVAQVTVKWGRHSAKSFTTKGRVSIHFNRAASLSDIYPTDVTKKQYQTITVVNNTSIHYHITGG